jgi:Flp pilus assembly protein TadD
LLYNSLGLIYLKTNRREEARQAWLKAIELDPYNQGYQKNLQLLEQGLQASPSASPQP